MKSTKQAIPVLLVAILAGLGMSCGGTYGTGGRPIDSDYFLYAGATTGSVITPETDVRCPSPNTLNMTVHVELAAVSPGAGTVNPPTVQDTFQVTKYIV